MLWSVGYCVMLVIKDVWSVAMVLCRLLTYFGRLLRYYGRLLGCYSRSIQFYGRFLVCYGRFLSSCPVAKML